MYHVIADPPADARIRSSTSPATHFGRQIAWLARHGFHAVTLQDAYVHWRFGRACPPTRS